MKRQILEGLIFLSGDEGIDEQQLLEIMEIDSENLNGVVSELKEHHAKDESSLQLVVYGDKFKFVTKPFLYEYARKLLNINKVKNLSQSALETLAIIAYKQPITRMEIEEIRGVSSEIILRRLMAMDLISEAGRLDSPGRPILYQVTESFMDGFKIMSLDELPELEAIEVDTNEDLYK